MTDNQNTSATGGSLLPASCPAPLQDDALTDFLQELVVGLTGLEATKVRPRWQPTPPNRPDISEDWAALGITELDGDTYAYEQHLPNVGAAGADLLYRAEDLEILVSFYGPHAGGNASLLRDGLSIAQNRDALAVQGISLKAVGKLRQLPDLLNERWYSRWDVPITFSRGILRIYPILTLLSADGDILAEGNPIITVPITVTEN